MFRIAVPAALAVALAPVPASAAPTYLTCTLTDSNGPSQFDVQINEDSGTVSYFTHRSQMMVTRPAIFTPQAVSFFGFLINRVDLSFQRTNDPSLLDITKQAPVDYGKCVLDSAKRAF